MAINTHLGEADMHSPIFKGKTALYKISKMLIQKPLRSSIWVLLAFVSILDHGKAEKCENYGPTVKQTQMGFTNPPKFSVEVQNACPMCPVINIHLKCGNFSQALVNPRRLTVVRYNDCVVNGGWPLAPLQTSTFTYSHQKYNISPASWNFQCE